MSQLIESIKIKNGSAVNLDLHIARMNNSSKELWGSDQHSVDFETILNTIASLDPDSIYKLRLIYDADSFDFEFLPYSNPQIDSLKLVEAPEIDYSNKYLDRSSIKKAFKKRASCDDILITQHGMVTDSFYCNVAFKQGNDWFTPDLPLLKGIKRQQLLNSGMIKESEISIEDIPEFEMITLFNAMIEFKEIRIDISQISFED